jgi:predicted nucleic acid-binding protein
MPVFVDTSALLAVLDADDTEHTTAKKIWEYLIQSNEVMVCSNYILVETFALVQHRLGMEAVRLLHEDIVPLLDTVWVDEAVHRAGLSAVLVAWRRKLSLVDCVSFEVMRRLNIRKAFCFDTHFEELGFEVIHA